MRMIPLLRARTFASAPPPMERFLGHDGRTWAIYDGDSNLRRKVRDLNSYEARFINSVQQFEADKTGEHVAQLRRDLSAARAQTAAIALQWREALGADRNSVEIDPAEVTRDALARLRRLEGQLDELHNRARYFKSPGLVRYDAEGYGFARGLTLAGHMVGGVAYEMPERPPVWGCERETVRGQYRLRRSQGYGPFGAAWRALIVWDEPNYSSNPFA